MLKNKIKFVPTTMHINLGDNVIVISGKDKGKIGKVVKKFTKKGKIIVEGVNLVTKHLKPTQDNPQGGVVKKPNPIYSSKVMVYCEKCKKGVRISKKVLEDGSKVRSCRKCGEVL